MRVFVLLAALLLTGCSTLLPSVATTSASAAVGCVAGGPLGCVAGAAAGDAVGELLFREEPKVRTLYGLLDELVETAGWVLAAYIGASVGLPFLLGWILPQPKRRRKDVSSEDSESP